MFYSFFFNCFQVSWVIRGKQFASGSQQTKGLLYFLCDYTGFLEIVVTYLAAPWQKGIKEYTVGELFPFYPAPDDTCLQMDTCNISECSEINKLILILK